MTAQADSDDFDPVTYLSGLADLQDRDNDPAFQRRRVSGVRIARLDNEKTLAVVAAAAERSWRLLQSQGPEAEHPRQVEFEAWSRRALDAMWDRLATGGPITFSDCDPAVIPSCVGIDETDIGNAMAEAFEFARSLVSAETACYPILHSQCWFLSYLRVDLREHRGDWYASVPEIGTSEHACYVETNAIQFLNPLRIAPERWLDRDLTFVERSGADADFAGLREVAANDVRVALELKDRLHEVVVPATGPITSAVWPPELCELVDAAIDQTCRQPPPA